jgi:hypothetical protein
VLAAAAAGPERGRAGGPKVGPQSGRRGPVALLPQVGKSKRSSSSSDWRTCTIITLNYRRVLCERGRRPGGCVPKRANNIIAPRRLACSNFQVHTSAPARCLSRFWPPLPSAVCGERAVPLVAPVAPSPSPPPFSVRRCGVADCLARRRWAVVALRPAPFRPERPVLFAGDAIRLVGRPVAGEQPDRHANPAGTRSKSAATATRPAVRSSRSRPSPSVCLADDTGASRPLAVTAADGRESETQRR